MMMLAAIHEYRNLGGRKTLCFERTDQQTQARLQWLRQRQGLLGHCVRNGVRMGRQFHPLGTAGLLAHAHGFSIQGFDPKKRVARDLEDREGAMVSRLTNTPHGAGDSLVIITGAAHAAKLHELFAPQVPGTLAIAVMPSAVLPGENETRNRMSHLLSAPGVVTIRPSPQRSDGELGAAQFIGRELAPWHLP
jgi:hypothetical protein